jgi:signal transduction histidine kinase
MLPSSHLVPINASLNESHSDETSGLHAQSILADAFSEFISASSRLENSYRELQQEVSALGIELADRNAALNTSLAENERMRLALEQIVDSMPCGVMVLDRDGAITMINPESVHMLGLELNSGLEFARNDLSATLGQISAASGVNLESFYQNESGGKPSRDNLGDTSQEFCVRTGSNTTSNNAGKRWLEIRNRRIFSASTDQAGTRPDQTILILRDITAQKRAEQERESARKAMALAEITTILAHEIRNPLASLELFAGLLETDDDRRDEWISNLRAGIRSLAGTVNNVLSFHGSGSLPLTPVPLAALIGNAIEFVRPIAQQAAVELRWLNDSVDFSDIQVLGNPSALQQVVLNLVANAIRHTPTGGNITVSLRKRPDDRVMVEFSDTGCGIRPEQIARVFEPGFSGSGQGSGLGLAVCDRIMKQHGGGISVTSRVDRFGRNDQGCDFLLDFPVLQMELATA